MTFFLFRSESTLFPYTTLFRSIAPTAIYNNVPTLSPEEAADMIIRAIVYKPVNIATRLGTSDRKSVV